MSRLMGCNLVMLLFVFIFPALVFSQSEKVTYVELEARYMPQSRPEETVHLELDLLTKGMYCYDLPLFDPAWRTRGKKILYSPRYKQTAKKFDVKFKVYEDGKHAIVYYPDNKSEGPDFLYRTNEGWILDRTAVWDHIHYNYSNTGWFAYDGNYPYLSMLKKVFSLEKVKLNKGIWAYQIKE